MAGSDDVETVGLDLTGDFAVQAEKDAAAAKALGDAFGKLDAASQKLKAPQAQEAARYSAITSELEQQASLEAKIASFDGQRLRNVAALEAKYKAMKDAALGVKPPAAAGKDPLSFNANAG